MDDYLTRTKLLLGEDKVASLQEKTILVVGLGGVGGTALECLARSGIGHFIIVDADTVAPSNLNRQILFVASDIGKDKTVSAQARISAISPNIQVEGRKMFVSPENIQCFANDHIDFIVDAIDSVEAKVALIGLANERNIPIICSLGMGKRLDSGQITLTNLDKTHDDPLAKKLRYLVRKKGIDPKTVMTVFSTESPLTTGRTLPSMMMVPSSAGLRMAGYVIMSLSKTD